MSRTAGLNQLGPSPSAMKYQQRGYGFGYLTADRIKAAKLRGTTKAHLFGLATRRKKAPITLATINLPPDNG